MFKLAKYYVLVNIYKRARFSVLLVLISLVLMFITALIFSDLMAMVNVSGRTVLIAMKWLILFILIGLMAYHLRKILRSTSHPFGTTEGKSEIVVNKKRERLMAKENLHSRSDLVLEKYRRTR
jgi:NADH:ubiquinone oxidoreductase subunit H